MLHSRARCVALLPRAFSPRADARLCCSQVPPFRTAIQAWEITRFPFVLCRLRYGQADSRTDQPDAGARPLVKVASQCRQDSSLRVESLACALQRKVESDSWPYKRACAALSVESCVLVILSVSLVDRTLVVFNDFGVKITILYPINVN